MRRGTKNRNGLFAPNSHYYLQLLTIFVLSFACNCKATEEVDSPPKPCDYLLPGLHKLQRGVDVTKLDLLPLRFNGNDGFKYPVIDFNCLEGKTRKIGDGDTVYNVPDEVFSIMTVPGGWLDAEVNIMKKSSDVVKVLSSNIGVDTIVKGLFSASASYKHITEKFYNESRYIEHIITHQSTYKADLIPKFALKLGRYARMFVDHFLPNKFEEDPQKYFEFIKTFGTHYFKNVNFGGTFQLYLETAQSYYRGKSDKDVKAEASGTFFKIIKGFGGASHSVKKVDTLFTKNSHQILRYYGGNTNLLASGGISKWQPTVLKNPWVSGGQLTPLSELITNKEKKESMQKATQIYIALAYLNSLKSLTRWANNKYSTYAQQISSFEKRIQALIESKTIDQNAVNQLGNEIEEQLEIPSWFYDNVQLCYKWWADGDGGQCGGGAANNLCAKVGTMTSYYRDDTDGRGGGCRMQWGVMKAGGVTQNWLSQVQICYSWWPDGNGGQCGGGVGRNLCAPLNKFTTAYRDDSDGRGGGCRMKWKLVVPSSAPIWLKSMKICFQWYPDGDGGQCGGGAARLLCAIANSWTAPYRDDTDGRGGGCRMRWGIIPN